MKNIMMMKNSMKLMFYDSDATKYTVKGDIVIFCTRDDHSYYLAKLITHIYETEVSEKNNYKHKMPAQQKVIACSYSKIYEDIKESTIYYNEHKKKAIPTYCMAGVCARLEILQEKCCGSTQDMHLVTNDINEAILGLLNEEIMPKYLYQKTVLGFLV